MKWTHNGYTVDDDRDRLNIDRIINWIRGTYWGKKRDEALVSRSWRNSVLVFGVYHEGEIVGCARVVSDLVTTAYLADVFLLPEHRGRGIGHFLVASILGHPALATVKWLLHTEDAQTLYRRFGFLDRTERLMERPAPGSGDS